MFGRPVPKEIVEKRGEPVRYWGARAIFHPGTKHPIDLLPDRQSCKCAEGLASKPLLDWLNTVGMKELQNMRAFKRTVLRQHRGRRVQGWAIHDAMLLQTPATAISTSGRGSIGRRTAGMSRRTPDPTAKWSSDKFPVPAIGSKIKASINGQWEGVVTGYFVEHGYQGIEVDCSQGKRPDFYREARRRSQAGAAFRRGSDGGGNRLMSFQSKLRAEGRDAPFHPEISPSSISTGRLVSF